jgi:diguanylate cyclase (GGDEF)-like protein
MEIIANPKLVSSEEKAQISRQVKAELIEHLYQGCLPGTISGIPVGIAIFVDFYKHTPLGFLISWFIAYLFALGCLTGLYFIYRRYQHTVDLDTWLYAYTGVMCMCATLWGISVFMIPDDLTRQYFAFIALFLIATGYSNGTIGQFYLCVMTLTLIVVPLVVWCFMKGALFYNLIGFFSLIYIGFMTGINRRSTEWFKDSLKLKLENTLVSYQANHDLLTKLPNQRMLPQYIDSAISVVNDTANTFVLIAFSPNRMEMINDSLGHKAGDFIIESVAGRLTALAEKLSQNKNEKKQFIVTISRKDTFNIIIVPLQADQIEQNIKMLFSVVDEPYYLENQPIKLTASIGVSVYKKDGQDVKTLFTNADAAMLRAKQFGGNSMEFYRAEINEHTPKKLELETDLHAAVEGNQLRLHYQPLIDARTGKISGMEALIRWQHPVQGMIPPGRFIPLAEETGLIVPIGQWVIEEACRQTLIWHKMGFNTLKVAVNLAEKQLRQGNIIAIIQRILDESGFDHRYLELEITETAMLDEEIINTIKQFKEMGLALAVDDFGTGYSGLSYLKRFSINKIKVDQSFIRDIPENNDSMTIVSAILAMARELKVTTLAEGVETKEQLDFLQSKGCDYIQGYYFSKPLETDFFTQLLLKQKEETEAVS